MNSFKNLVCLWIVSQFLFASAFAKQDQNSTPAETVEKANPSVRLSDDGNRIKVDIDGNVFTQFEYRDYSKPIFYPINLTAELGMTRHYPMKEVAGEAPDHPHHMSLWIGHEVNGLDFWACKTGDIEFQKIESLDSAKREFTVRNHWVKKSDGSVVLTELTRYRFGADGESRWIDAEIRFLASHGNVTFDDTKEGLFAVRTHPSLRLSPVSKTDTEVAVGTARNSGGVTGKAIWGKPAKWLDYSGKIAGQQVGISMFDHPDNLRHPTTWHAREYGLVAANPFGLHYFNGGEKGVGAVKIAKGDELKLRYRILFYHGPFDAEKTESRFVDFAK